MNLKNRITVSTLIVLVVFVLNKLLLNLDPVDATYLVVISLTGFFIMFEIREFLSEKSYLFTGIVFFLIFIFSSSSLITTMIISIFVLIVIMFFSRFFKSSKSNEENQVCLNIKIYPVITYNRAFTINMLLTSEKSLELSEKRGNKTLFGWDGKKHELRDFNEGDLIAVEVFGDSFNPQIREKDILLMVKTPTEELETGDLIIVNKDSNTKFFSLVRFLAVFDSFSQIPNLDDYPELTEKQAEAILELWSPTKEDLGHKNIYFEFDDNIVGCIRYLKENYTYKLL